MRIGDAAIETLKKTAGEGRITLDDLEDRMERVQSARFPIDLDEVLADVTSELPSQRVRAEADGGSSDDVAVRRSGVGWSAESREIAVITFTASESAEEGCPTFRVKGSSGVGVLQVVVPNRRQRRMMSR